jgi:hypothetical protein
MENDLEMRLQYIREGYTFLRFIPGRGWCGIQRMLYTAGLFYGLSKEGREGRYCFETMYEAIASLADWNGLGDPQGDWIKHFSRDGEYGNPEHPGFNPDLDAGPPGWVRPLPG